MRTPIWFIPALVVVFGALYSVEASVASGFAEQNDKLLALVKKQTELITIQGQTLDLRAQTIDAQKRIISAEEDNVGVCVSMLPIEQRRSFQGGN